MAATFDWVITALECYPEHEGFENVVFTVHWRRVASSGSQSTDIYGAENLTLDGASPFTPYDKLTKEQVVGWLVDALGVEYVAQIDAGLAVSLQQKINPQSVAPPLPW